MKRGLFFVPVQTTSLYSLQLYQRNNMAIVRTYDVAGILVSCDVGTSDFFCNKSTSFDVIFCRVQSRQLGFRSYI